MPETQPSPSPTLSEAYAYCQDLANSHYENFPVASRLLPKRMRQPVAVVYAFARTADDMADEGDLSPEQRLAELDEYGTKLDAIQRGEASTDPVFIALADVQKQFNLPAQLFHDLLTAFRLDVTKERYDNFQDVLDYCHYSADPVGRLLLHLHGSASEENLQMSDHICSALQLINFLQDIRQDYKENNRIYLSQDELSRFGISEEQIREGQTDDKMRELMALQISRSREMMLAGAPLGRRVGGRFGLELRLIIQGGLRVLERLEQYQHDLLARPRLGKSDWIFIVLRALFKT